jgi:diguanylate cyclase (GGDEF)-like protein
MTPEEANALNTSMTKDIKETLSIPIKVKEKIFGILNIDTKKQFTSEDIEILNYYADSIVSNLYNSQLLEKTIYLSRYDKLTNIYNRNFFEDILEDVIEKSITENYYFAFVLLDMNYLKEINDNYGHKVGDDALIHLTDSIKKYLKKDDIFARLGGDEFVVIFDKTDFDTAEQKIKYILDDLINNPLSVNSNVDLEKLPVTFSYGISTAPYESLVLDILLKLSDHRMYEFKTKFKEKYPELKPGSN